MYKIYLKQTIFLLKQNQFISIITIAGTALAIMMIMAIIVTYEIKTFSGGSEPNRHRTLYVNSFVLNESEFRSISSLPNYDIAKPVFTNLKIPESVSFTYKYGIDDIPTTPVRIEGDENIYFMGLRSCDVNYWKIMSFEFIEGTPFSQEEIDSRTKIAILSESTAKKLYKGQNAVGQNIEIDFTEYRVTGVVKDISPVYTDAYSEIWIPYYSGRCKIIIVAKNKNDFEAITDEIREAEKQYNLTIAPQSIMYSGPETRWTEQIYYNVFRPEERAISISKENKRLAFIITILLLVPALNLSGFSISRVRKRMAEIATRKAFGAKKHTILIQVLFENMITSVIGGLIGLFLSYVIILNYKDWLLGIPPGSYLPVSTLVSVPVWISVFTVCMAINLLSAGIPAIIASRAHIVDSLTQNVEI